VVVKPHGEIEVGVQPRDRSDVEVDRRAAEQPVVDPLAVEQLVNPAQRTELLRLAHIVNYDDGNSLTQQSNNAEHAKAIIDANRYMTLGTADAGGVPWVTPVWFATANYREFFWVSKPEAQHSRNIAQRPQVAIVVFDSQVPVGGAKALYMSADAAELAGDELDRGLEVFSRISQAQELPEWTLDDVQAPARHRLYRATASAHFVLTAREERIAVHLE
jgi:Pyridoxamine 5'-phosphate oxidase